MFVNVNPVAGLVETDDIDGPRKVGGFDAGRARMFADALESNGWVSAALAREIPQVSPAVKNAAVTEDITGLPPAIGRLPAFGFLNHDTGAAAFGSSINPDVWVSALLSIAPLQGPPTGGERGLGEAPSTGGALPTGGEEGETPR